MAQCFYTECLNTWKVANGEDSQWITHDLTQYGVPPSAVAEIAVGSLSNIGSSEGGVRSTSGTIQRKIDIVKSYDGNSYATMHVQVDESGCIQVYAEEYNTINFNLMGYWLGCEYVEDIKSFGAEGDGVWEGYSLSSYDVSEDAIVDITMANSNTTESRTVGVRASGSSRNLTFDISDAEDGGNNCVSQLIRASGSTSAIQIYAEDHLDCNLFFLGYFSSAPGQYTETSIRFPEPGSELSWQTLDVGASGIPQNCVAEFVLGQSYTDDQDIGVRSTSSDVARFVNLEESEDNDGLSCVTMHVNVDSGGEVQYYAEDISPDDPEFHITSYWTDFVNVDIPFPHTGSVDCYIYGRNPHIHYIELDGLLTPSRFTASMSDSWSEHDLTQYGVHKSTPEDGLVVAEIAIVNKRTLTPSYHGGVRSLGSSLDRSFYMHTAVGAGIDALSVLVPVDADGKVELYSESKLWIEFGVIGFWKGGEYEESATAFQATAENSWTNHNLGSEYEDKIVEIIVTNANAIQQSGGVRAVGSVIHRCNVFTKASDGEDHTTMHVLASGANGTIQVYSSDSGDVTFTLAGYWKVPPGTYHEAFTDVGTATGSATWEAIDIGISGGLIAEMASENWDTGAEREMGVREVGSQYSTRRWDLRENDLADNDACDTFRSFVNITSGTHIDVRQETLSYEHVFRLLGYWNDIDSIAVQTTSSCNLYISGIPGFISTSGDQGGLYPSGVSLYIYGIHTSPTIPLYIAGISTEQASGNLFTHGIFYTDILDNPKYPDGVTIFIDGFGVIPESGQTSLFVHGNTVLSGSSSLFASGLGFHSEYGNLFLKTIEPLSASADLVLYSPIDPGSGLIRESNAIFYLKDYVHEEDVIEHVQNSTWNVPTTHFFATPVVGDYYDTETAGDGTLPFYNSLGKGISAGVFGTPFYGGGTTTTQIVFGTVPDDYPYVSSGITSLTTAFWMSGSQIPASSQVNIEGDIQTASGAQVNVGWFLYDGGSPHHTLGLETRGESGLVVRTTVNTSEEEWPEINLARENTTFFVIHSEFVPSGDGIPNHMMVYLSADGQPWIYIGSGTTDPPTSSTENRIGFHVVTNKWHGGQSGVSVGIAEMVLWSDADIFTNDELYDLYHVVNTYKRPLDEYHATLDPPGTYITRTLSNFTYDPIVPIGGDNYGSVTSGCLVTIEVGLGNYGEEANAYLLEETIPSGFIVRNISPSQITVDGQRPDTTLKQASFNDPQSGVLKPYDNSNGNIYGSQIKWVNHDNHPEHNQRRSIRPTKVFTYELYPVFTPGISTDTTFTLSGSGLFFGGSAGTFVTTTTGTTSGSASSTSGAIVYRTSSLYVSGPCNTSRTANLYLRAVEPFNSAYIGIAPRTPEAMDFAYSADGVAATETMAGVEYGPPLIIKGPLYENDERPLFIRAPEGDNVDLFTHGHLNHNTSGSFPSGVPLCIWKGHEVSSKSGNLVMLGPLPSSGTVGLYTMAGAFTRVGGGAGHGNSPPLYMTSYHTESGTCNLFINGPEPFATSASLYIKGPEFICSSGTFAYPYDPDDFAFPYGGLSPPLFMYRPIGSHSGTANLFIMRFSRPSFTMFLKTAGNSRTGTTDLFIHGFQPPSGSSGVSQSFRRAPLFVEAVDVDYPYTNGGTDNWTLFLKAQDGNISSNDAWTLFLKADTTTTEYGDLYTYGHASGSPPHGRVQTGTANLICSVDPDDLWRIGYTPFNTDTNPWTLFLKVKPGAFNTSRLYVSGSVPSYLAVSGNLFVEGLFGEQIGTAPLYLMGISGTANNGPSGVPLFLQADILVYNNYMHLYLKGY